jgi:hypothetical protein
MVQNFTFASVYNAIDNSTCVKVIICLILLIMYYSKSKNVQLILKKIVMYKSILLKPWKIKSIQFWLVIICYLEIIYILNSIIKK